MKSRLKINNTTLLIVIDVQKDFINKNTKHIPNRIENLIQNNKFNYIVFTKFINDKDSNFHKVLNYKGCMTKEDRKIVIDTKNNKVLEKRTYTALTPELMAYLKENKIEDIYLCGIETDACLLKTAIDLFEKNYNIKVIEYCTMSTSGRRYHKYAIKMLKKLIGKGSIA